MSDGTTIDKLKSLLASDPSALQGLAGSGDVKDASAAIAQFAASKGLTISAAEVEKAFQERGAGVAEVQPLDDAALDLVAGGGSPYCIFTKGCYCIFTK